MEEQSNYIMEKSNGKQTNSCCNILTYSLSSVLNLGLQEKFIVVYWVEYAYAFAFVQEFMCHLKIFPLLGGPYMHMLPLIVAILWDNSLFNMIVNIGNYYVFKHKSNAIKDFWQ